MPELPEVELYVRALRVRTLDRPLRRDRFEAQPGGGRAGREQEPVRSDVSEEPALEPVRSGIGGERALDGDHLVERV